MFTSGQQTKQKARIAKAGVKQPVKCCKVLFYQAILAQK